MIVQDNGIPGPGGPIPIRVYRPAGTPETSAPIILFAHGGGYTKDDLLTVATTVGYDPDALEAAMAEQGIREQIRNAYDVAEALGIRGTPAFVIGEQVIPGAVSEARLREAIAEARAAAAEKG